MEEQNVQAPDSQLGALMLRCRNRSPAAAGLDLGASWVQIFFGPLMVALLMTIPVVIAIKALELRPNPILGLSVVFWYVASAAAVYWYFFTASDSATLVLFEHGFQYKNRIVRFADLTAIRHGRVFSPLIASFVEGAYMFNKLIGTFSRGNRLAAAYYENCQQASLTLEFKDGRPRWSMNRVLVEHPRVDVDAFLKTIADKHPELFRPSGEASDHLFEMAC
jgi:hypothetical protein